MAKNTFKLSKTVEITNSVKNYFANFKFEKSFRPFANFPLDLHWADARILIEKVRAEAKFGDEKFYHEKQFAIGTVESLKKVPIWLKNGDYVIPMTMFDIYSSLGQFIKKEAMEDELFNCHEISFIGPSGPFKNMPLINCVNEQTLNIYLHWMVMVNKLPQRAFRLNTKGHVAADFIAQDQTDSNLLNVEQITDSGILLSSKNDFLLERTESIEELKVYFNTEKMLDAVKSEKNRSDEIFFSKDKLHYFKISKSKLITKLKYNSHHSGEFFLFCRYFDMYESEVPEIMKDFTSETKKIILDSVA
jgi:hypothetical protein